MSTVGLVGLSCPTKPTVDTIHNNNMYVIYVGAEVHNKGEVHPQWRLLGFLGINCVHSRLSWAGKQL